ncbi:MAG: hypothetical protein WB507_00530 [Solirubrobacterales bacterium]
MTDFVVVPNTFSGWDVMHGEDPIAMSNHPDQRSAMAAARIFLAEEHQRGTVRLDTVHPHGIDDPATGVRSAFIFLFALLLSAALILVAFSLASAASGL